MSDAAAAIERQLNRLEAKALLHGRTDAISADVIALVAKLYDLDPGAAEDWLMKRDEDLGRALGPMPG